MQGVQRLFFTERKIGARIRELAEFRYRDAISLESMQYQIDTSGDVGLYPPTDGEWKPAVMNQRWQGRDLRLGYCYRGDSEWKQRKVLGRFDFGKTGGGVTPALSPCCLSTVSPTREWTPITKKYFSTGAGRNHRGCPSGCGPALRRRQAREQEMMLRKARSVGSMKLPMIWSLPRGRP